MDSTNTTTPITAASQAYHDALDEMLNDAPAARYWLEQFFELVIHWDHVVDADPVDRHRFDQLLNAALVEWPSNEFWARHARLLAPVIAQATARWRNSDRLGEFEVYLSVPLAVAFIIGGQPRCDEFAGILTPIVHTLRAEDNDRDKQGA